MLFGKYITVLYVNSKTLLYLNTENNSNEWEKRGIR